MYCQDGNNILDTNNDFEFEGLGMICMWHDCSAAAVLLLLPTAKSKRTIILNGNKPSCAENGNPE
jgi:hypothetical protein